MARKKNSEELEQLRGCIEYLGSQLETEQVQSNPWLLRELQRVLDDSYRQHYELSTGQARGRSTSNINGSGQG